MTVWTKYASDGTEFAVWDVIIVGAGLGGGVAGLTLAQQGLSVLFLERGKATNPFTGGSRKPGWKKLFSRDAGESRATAGRWPERIRVTSRGKNHDFFPPLGSGPGGSSAIYGAALERFRRIDFAATDFQSRGPNALPDDWPLDYASFAKWYSSAEQLMDVAGTSDPLDPDDRTPLRPPPPLSRRDEYLYDTLARAGLSPYRAHVGISYRPGCMECLGYLCPRDCKAEGASRGLAPALARHGAGLVLECDALRLEVTGDRISGVISRVNGCERTYRSKLVILAAGALASPLILRRSTSERWPNGVGNDHDLLGRGLMFHVSDFFSLKAPPSLSKSGPAKSLASRAFYTVDGVKLGSFQSVGAPLTAGNIYQYLADRWEWLFPSVMPAQRLPLYAVAKVAERFIGEASLFATILEDFPYATNRLYPDVNAPSGFVIEYAKPRELEERTLKMRRLISEALSRLTPWFLSPSHNLNYGHPLGTCRIGHDPRTSVLSADCKVRGTENLYVVDGSIFPSSGGVNPSLTIVANALRVGDLIGREFASGRFDKRQLEQGQG